jgi:hypothetical protein
MRELKPDTVLTASAGGAATSGGASCAPLVDGAWADSIAAAAVMATTVARKICFMTCLW